MFRTLKRGGLVVGVLGALGIVGAGCLTRPVKSTDPDTKTNFTSVVKNQAVDKIDLLFMIDNSASMGDKQALLAQAVPDMITRLVSPFCLDANGNYTTTHVDAKGNCPMGDTAEFPPVHDMHLGIVSSSLGARGGDVAGCQPGDTNPANPSLNAHGDDKGELINRGGVAGDPTQEMPVGDAAPDNFLGWFPDPTGVNAGHTPPPGKAITTVGDANTPGTLIGDFAEMIEGVHEHGCGFEAQNEAWYRFLVQPDPFDNIALNNNRATLNGIDKTILAQRAAFLRPDSLVAVIDVTDENEEVANPMSIGGQGWAFESSTFPGSPNGSAPQGTIECTQQDPNNPLTTGPNNNAAGNAGCTSCAFIQGASNFAQRCPKDGNAGQNGFLDPANDSLNVRFFNQKLRFGLFAGYPTSRYVRGLTQRTVPDSQHEVDKNGNYIGDQTGNANCVNPLYAQNLPTDPSKDLCNLTRGPRTPDLVYYAAIVGVPHQLLQAQPGSAECPAGTSAADCPQKAQLSDADWTLIGGKDPEHYDFTGSDYHMVESENPRTMQGANGLPTVWANVSSCPPNSADDCDKDSSGKVLSGREWNTNKGDLQFACIFDLRPQFGGTGKDCTQAKYQGACDCSQGTNPSNTAQTPLCAKDSTGAYSTTQIYGKAYPSVRETVLAHKMGAQGILSSLCPIHVQDNATNSDPLYGYRPAVKAIVDRLKNSLSNQCLPQKLTPDQCNNVPCLILEQKSTPVGPGACANPGSACDPMQGLLAPSPNGPYYPDVAQKFCEAQEAAWKAAGGANSNLTDPDTLPTCALQELSEPPPAANAASCPPGSNLGVFNNHSCAGSSTPGWCYVTGAAAKGCPQAILFSSQPPSGVTVSLQCIESTQSAIPDAGGGD
jgi:hypothetical protein